MKTIFAFVMGAIFGVFAVITAPNWLPTLNEMIKSVQIPHAPPKVVDPRSHPRTYDPLPFFPDPNRARTNLYVLAVGVDEYSDPTLTSLKYAAHDAEHFAAELEAQCGDEYDAVKTEIIVNGDATQRNIHSHLTDTLKRASKDDAILIFLAGHGIVDNDKYYFLPTDAIRSDLSGSGVNLGDFKKILDGLLTKGAAVMMFLDTCHPIVSADGSRAVVAAPDLAAALREQETQLGSIPESQADEFLSRIQEGQIIVGSAGQDEESHEGDADIYKVDPSCPGHGIFTATLIRGMRGEADTNRDGKVTTQELVQFLEAHVPGIGMQHPYHDGELNIELGKAK